MGRSAIHLFNPFDAGQKLQEAASLPWITPERIKVSCQNPETFNRQLGHNLESTLFHFCSNLISSVEERIGEVQDFVCWVPMLPRPNVRLHYREKSRVTKEAVTGARR